jgi:aminoglycoside phosphotransferase (APT) family kinase protein
MKESDRHRDTMRHLWPEISVDSFVPIGDGWTCDTYAVNRRWIVQFPKTEYAEESLHRQKVILPCLASRLPVAVPCPVPASDPEAPAMLYRRIQGESFPRRPAGTWPEQLGSFLLDLQRIEAKEIRLSERSAADLHRAKRAQLEKMRERVLTLMGRAERTELDGIFREYLQDEQAWSFRPVVVHNDLGPAHILVDERGDLSGVIDWEEISVGDPAADFAWMLGEFPEIGGRILKAFGGEPDEGFRARARFLYLLMPFYEVIYGQESGQPEFIGSGLEGIRTRLRKHGE